MPNNIPLQLSDFMKGFRKVGFIPNIFEDIETEPSSEPYEAAGEYGYNRSGLLVNAGHTISQILPLLGLYPILLLVSRCWV